MNADYELDDSGMGLELQIKNGSKIAGIGGFFRTRVTRCYSAILDPKTASKT